MNARLCPHCSALIESESALFCYSCGGELELPSRPDSSAVIKEAPTPSWGGQAPRSLWPAASLFLLFLGVSFAAFYLIFFHRERVGIRPGALSPTQPSVIPLTNEFVSTVSALPVSPFDLSRPTFSEIVPADVPVFWQSRSPVILLRRLLGESEKEDLAEVTGLTLDEAVSFLDEDYAFIGSESGSAFLARVKDSDFVKAKIAEAVDTRVKARLFGDRLVVSDSESVLKEISSVVGKSKLSLWQKTEFFDGLRQLPKVGQALIYVQKSSLLPGFLDRIFDSALFEGGLTGLSGQTFILDSSLGSVKVTGIYGAK